ncbi:MAG: hypothetical protein EBQ82_11570 [Betaproteobacteria bacterium]|nr:hypothetical protein [Betaproteobacteria bacterium]NBY05999.1 hypothetical protein [Betaproteobacteria bacterium]
MSKTPVILSLALGLVLSACMEKPQTLGTKTDAPPFTGTGNAPAAFVNSGWKAGDKTSWEQALRARAQAGQNDHAKTN